MQSKLSNGRAEGKIRCLCTAMLREITKIIAFYRNTAKIVCSAAFLSPIFHPFGQPSFLWMRKSSIRLSY